MTLCIETCIRRTPCIKREGVRLIQVSLYYLSKLSQYLFQTSNWRIKSPVNTVWSSMGQQNIQANIKVDSKRSARKHILVATQVTVRDCFFCSEGNSFRCFYVTILIWRVQFSAELHRSEIPILSSHPENRYGGITNYPLGQAVPAWLCLLFNHLSHTLIQLSMSDV